MSCPGNGLAGTSRQVADDRGFNVYVALPDFIPRSANRGLSRNGSPFHKPRERTITNQSLGVCFLRGLNAVLLN